MTHPLLLCSACLSGSTKLCVPHVTMSPCKNEVSNKRHGESVFEAVCFFFGAGGGGGQFCVLAKVAKLFSQIWLLAKFLNTILL